MPRSFVVALTLVMGVGGCSGDESRSGSPGAAGAAPDAATGAPDARLEVGADAPPDGGGLFYEDRTLNIAHRGGGGLAPEATLAAFRNALDVGADALEFDVHATSDGVLIVMHDDTVDRTTDGTGAIKDMTFDELRQLDAGYRFSPDGRTFPWRGMGLRVPSVEEILDGFPSAHFVIEIKQARPSVVDDLVALLRAKSVGEDRAVVGSFDGTVVKALRAAAPELLTSFALGEVVEFLALTPETEPTYVAPGDFLQVPTEQAGIPIVSESAVDRAHRLGLGVHVWTINDRAQMAELVSLGVEGIITDDPEKLAEVLGG